MAKIWRTQGTINFFFGGDFRTDLFRILLESVKQARSLCWQKLLEIFVRFFIIVILLLLSFIIVIVILPEPVTIFGFWNFVFC